MSGGKKVIKFKKPMVWLVLVLVAQSPIATNAGNFEKRFAVGAIVAGAGAAGYLLGKSNSDKGETHQLNQYTTNEVNITNNVFIDLEPIQKGLESIAQASREQVPLEYFKNIYLRYPLLKHYGLAIGLSPERSVSTAFIRDYGRAAYEKEIEVRLTELNENLVIASKISKALKGKYENPFKLAGMLTLINHVRHNVRHKSFHFEVYPSHRIESQMQGYISEFISSEILPNSLQIQDFFSQEVIREINSDVLKFILKRMAARMYWNVHDDNFAFSEVDYNNFDARGNQINTYADAWVDALTTKRVDNLNAICSSVLNALVVPDNLAWRLLPTREGESVPHINPSINIHEAYHEGQCKPSLQPLEPWGSPYSEDMNARVRNLKLFWNFSREDNFTTATEEGQADAKNAAYTFVRDEALISAYDGRNLVPLRTFYNASTGDNITTASTKTDYLTSLGFSFIRIEGYILKTRKAGSVPLELYWSENRKDFILVATKESRDSVKRSKVRYRKVSIEGYVYLP